MALTKSDGTRMYEGVVIDIYDHYWLDGMISEYAEVWDIENHEYKRVTIGYYGSDSYDFIGTRAEIEVSTEVARDIVRTIKQHARKDYCVSVTEKKNRIEKGIIAEVIRGRKVKKGTVLNVFWVGERPTYTGYGTELIAGCKDSDGNKVWIKAAYLRNITPIKSPNRKEREKYIKWYINRNVSKIVLDAARDNKPSRRVFEN